MTSHTHDTQSRVSGGEYGSPKVFKIINKLKLITLSRYVVPYPVYPTLWCTLPYPTLPYPTLPYGVTYPMMYPTLWCNLPHPLVYPTQPYGEPYPTLWCNLPYPMVYPTLRCTLPYRVWRDIDGVSAKLRS